MSLFSKFVYSSWFVRVFCLLSWTTSPVGIQVATTLSNQHDTANTHGQTLSYFLLFSLFGRHLVASKMEEGL